MHSNSSYYFPTVGTRSLGDIRARKEIVNIKDHKDLYAMLKLYFNPRSYQDLNNGAG